MPSNWDDRLSTLQKFLDLAVKYEVHAFLLIFIGAALYLRGVHEMGASAFSAGLAIFKGSR